MNKRIKKKKSKELEANFIAKICISKELKEDSIAHKIKNYFELGTLQQKMLFKWDSKQEKLFVSKKTLMYLLSLCNDVEQNRNYEMEIIDKIDVL